MLIGTFILEPQLRHSCAAVKTARVLRCCAADAFNVPCRKVIDSKLIAGAICFRVGWGVVRLCPGPALFLAAMVDTKPLSTYTYPFT